MKFSIRDLLLVTVIVAVLMAWWIDHSRFSHDVAREREFRSSLEEIKAWPFGYSRFQRIWGEPRPIGDY